MTVASNGEKHQLPITHYQLPITNYQLPITHYQLPITHYPLPIMVVLYTHNFVVNTLQIES
ncbi:hypothetical protein CEN48_13535 [Fischerella thermalis CCMEE 5282]|nr:hypothetical protein CEN48_13535 [Fischerella thermalis CCMEE 5282]